MSSPPFWLPQHWIGASELHHLQFTCPSCQLPVIRGRVHNCAPTGSNIVGQLKSLNTFYDGSHAVESHRTCLLKKEKFEAERKYVQAEFPELQTIYSHFMSTEDDASHSSHQSSSQLKQLITENWSGVKSNVWSACSSSPPILLPLDHLSDMEDSCDTFPITEEDGIKKLGDFTDAHNDLLTISVEEKSLNIHDSTFPELPTLNASSHKDNLKEIKQLFSEIQMPLLDPHPITKDENLNQFLSDSEITDVHSLVNNCLNAVSAVYISPRGKDHGSGFENIDFIDIYLSSFLRHAFMMFKSESFVSLLVCDQISLLRAAMKCNMMMNCQHYEKDTNVWRFRGMSTKSEVFVLHMSDLLQVFQPHLLPVIHEVFSKTYLLCFDTVTIVLCDIILFYTPINVYIMQMERIDALRNHYIIILLKYLTWRYGSANAACLFAQILKYLDAVLLFSEHVYDMKMQYDVDDISDIECRIASLNLSDICPARLEVHCYQEAIKEWPGISMVSLNTLHSRLTCAMQVTLLSNMKGNSAEYGHAASTYYAENLSWDSMHCHIKRTLPGVFLKEEMHDSDKKEKSLSHKEDQLHQLLPCQSLENSELLLLRKVMQDLVDGVDMTMLNNLKRLLSLQQLENVVKKLASY